jgi:hypothetical protein
MIDRNVNWFGWHYGNGLQRFAVAVLLAALTATAAAVAQSAVTVITGDARVDKLLSQATLEEKMALIRGAPKIPRPSLVRQAANRPLVSVRIRIAYTTFIYSELKTTPAGDGGLDVNLPAEKHRQHCQR